MVASKSRLARRLSALLWLAPSGAALVVAASSPTARADEGAAGSIAGVITNSSTREGVPEALVVIECTCMDAPRETRTNGQGVYRFAELRPGTYTVNIFAGQASVTKIVSVPRGTKMRVNASVNPGGEVRVIENISGPPVPPRGSSGIRIGPEILRAIPVGNDTERNPVGTAVALTSTGGRDASGPTTGGVTGAEMNYELNGVRINDPSSGTLGVPLVNEFVESVEVQEATYSAEYGSAGGGQVAVRRLAGTNKLRGTARFTFTPRLGKPRVIQGTDNAVRAQENFDYGMQGVVAMSGPIVRDRLFFSLGLAVLGTKSTLLQTFHHRVNKDGSLGYTGCPYENGAGDCEDGKDYIATKKFAEQTFPTGNLGIRSQLGIDWAINRNHKLGLTGSMTPAFLRRSYRRPLTSFDPDSLGASPNADPLGGGSTVANGVVGGAFGWDRSNAATAGLEYNGRVANDKIEIDAAAGYVQTGFDEAWRLDDPTLLDKTATQMTDADGANLFGFLDNDDSLDLVPGVREACNDSDLPGVSCPTRSWLSGGIGQYGRSRGRRLQGSFALTHFIDTRRAGYHQLKYGSQVEWLTRHRTLRYSGRNSEDFADNCAAGEQGGGEWCFDPGTDDYRVRPDLRVDNHRMIFADTDNPDQRQSVGFGRVRQETGQLRAIADPLGNGIRADRYESTVGSRNYGAFVQDRWAALSNLFLDVGMRWEGQDMRDLLGRRAVGVWDNVAPRASIVYDWTDEGRSRMYGSYGWFFQQMPVSLLNRVYGGQVNVIRTYRDQDCRSGELEIGGRKVRTSEDGQPTEWCADFGQSTTGLTEGAAVPKLQGQYDQALQLGYEQEVIEDLTIGVKWLHRDLGRAVEDVSTNGGLDFILANPGVSVDPGDIAAQRSTCDALSSRLDELAVDDDSRGDVGRQLHQCEFIADAYEKVGKIFDRPTRNFDAFSLEVRKRYAKNWLFIGSYTYSRLIGNYEGFVDPITGAVNLGSSLQFNTPELVRNSYGPLPYDTPHRLALDGFYTFDLDEAGSLTLGSSLRVRSGFPVSVRAGYNRAPGAYPIYVIPRGSAGRVATNYQLNASLQYAYPIGRGITKKDSAAADMAIAVGMRLFNVTNAKAALRVDEVYSFQNARPIAGGDLSDLKHAKIQDPADAAGFFSRRILERQGNYGVAAAFQIPLAAQFDVTLLF
jgi:hypothetical protein